MREIVETLSGKQKRYYQEHHYERLELKAYPHGFRLVMTHLPGRIEENV